MDTVRELIEKFKVIIVKNEDIRQLNLNKSIFIRINSLLFTHLSFENWLILSQFLSDIIKTNCYNFVVELIPAILYIYWQYTLVSNIKNKNDCINVISSLIISIYNHMVKNRDVFQFKPISLRDVSLFHKPNRVIIEEIAEDKLKDLLDECYSARSKLFHSCHVECSLIAENKLKIINFLLRQYINKFTDHCDESILQFLKLSIMVCTDGITSNFNCRIFDIDENVLLAFLEGTVFTLSYNMNLTSKSINGIQMRGDFELYPSIIMTIESLNQYMKINKIHLKDTTSDKIRLKRQSTNAVLMQRLTQGTFSPIKLPDDIDVEVQK